MTIELSRDEIKNIVSALEQENKDCINLIGEPIEQYVALINKLERYL